MICDILYKTYASIYNIYDIHNLYKHVCVCVYIHTHIQGPAQIMPLFYYKIFYFKTISMQLCNITI